MANPDSSRLVGNVLRLSALGCGLTGVVLLPVYPIVGIALCAVAIADLGVFWLLRSRSPALGGAGSSR